MAEGPLSGIRVLEFSLILAGPYAGMHLADMGADVIKVEQPPHGDGSRTQPGAVPGQAKIFQAMGRGRRALLVDLARPEGRALIHRLVPSIDVVVINYRPGVAERLGIDYETLRTIRPDLIYAEITGYGHEGPLAPFSASDIAASAYGGAIALNDATDEFGAPRPNQPPLAGDMPTGLATAMGVVGALYHRQRTGEGQRLHTSLLRSVMSVTCYLNNTDPVQDVGTRDVVRAALAETRARGGSYAELIEAKRARRRVGLYFHPYRAKDGGLVLGALTAANRAQIRGVLGFDDLDQDDPAYDPLSEAGRAMVERRQAEIRERLLSRTVAEWVADFNAVGAPVSPVNFPEELPDDPHARLQYMEVEHPVVGTTLQVRPMVDFERTPYAAHTPAPALGQHNVAVAREAGYSDEEIAALCAEGILAG